MFTHPLISLFFEPLYVQSLPPFLGLGLLHTLFLTLVALPQVTSQELQVPHSDQRPLTL